MRTIKIEITITESKENNFVSDIKEQIKFHLEQKKIADEQIAQLDLLVAQTRETVKNELNEFLGCEGWFKMEGKKYLGFKENGKNVKFQIAFFYELNRITYGNIQYDVPNIVKGVQIRLEGDYIGKILITDLNQIHETLKDSYLKYLTYLAIQ